MCVQCNAKLFLPNLLQFQELREESEGNGQQTVSYH